MIVEEVITKHTNRANTDDLNGKKQKVEEVTTANFTSKQNPNVTGNLFEKIFPPKNKTFDYSYSPNISTMHEKVLMAKEICDEFSDIIDNALNDLENDEFLEGYLANIRELIEKIKQMAILEQEKPIRRLMVLLKGAFKFFPSNNLTKEILKELNNLIKHISLYWPCNESDVTFFGVKLLEAGLDINKPFRFFPDQPSKIIIKNGSNNIIEILEIN